MKIKIGFSPCPNDTFIFDALVNNKIDTGELEFEAQLEDVETLNCLALEGSLEVTKISYAVLADILDTYIVLNSGSALGSGVGPLLISRMVIPEEEVADCTIAIPGEHTTAHMLFTLAYPRTNNKVFLRYDEIENFLLKESPPSVSNSKKAGVIIHENRFTYEAKGLKKIIDLGDFWQKKTQNPIPLGGIVAKRSIDQKVLQQIDKLIKESIEYSFRNYPAVSDYVRANSQEMSEDVMRKHIDLYVNEYSLNLGEKGRAAIKEFISIKENVPGLKFQKTQIFL